MGTTSDAAQCNLFQLLYVAFPVEAESLKIFLQDRNLIGSEQGAVAGMDR